MIATIRLPGGRIFRWCHVKNVKDAAEYRAAWLREKGESQETLQAVRDGLLLPREILGRISDLRRQAVSPDPPLPAHTLAGWASGR